MAYAKALVLPKLLIEEKRLAGFREAAAWKIYPLTWTQKMLLILFEISKHPFAIDLNPTKTAAAYNH
jgi:hypothetical protein